MGLDDFMDLDVDEKDTSESENTATSEPELLKYDSWTKDADGDLEKRGLYGYESREEYKDTIVGELETHGDLFKYHLPIFPHIEPSKEYERGNRYNRETDRTTVTCVSHNMTELHRVNREVIMLDTGHTEKENCLETLSNRFGFEVEPTTEVHMYFFACMRHIVKMAMGDEFVDSWNLDNKDRVLKAVYGETWTQKFREKNTGERDLKHTDHIKEW